MRFFVIESIAFNARNDRWNSFFTVPLSETDLPALVRRGRPDLKKIRTAAAFVPDASGAFFICKQYGPCRSAGRVYMRAVPEVFTVIHPLSQQAVEAKVYHTVQQCGAEYIAVAAIQPGMKIMIKDKAQHP